MTADEELRRAAQDYVDLFDTFNYPETAAMYPHALKAALAARSEPRAEGLRIYGLTLDEIAAAIATADMYHPQWRSAATPPAEGLDVERFRFMGLDRAALEHAIAYHDLHHPHALEQPEPVEPGGIRYVVGPDPFAPEQPKWEHPRLGVFNPNRTPEQPE